MVLMMVEYVGTYRMYNNTIYIGDKKIHNSILFVRVKNTFIESVKNYYYKQREEFKGIYNKYK